MEMYSIDVKGDTWVLKRKNESSWFSVHLLAAGRLVQSSFTGVDKEACLQFVWSRYENIEPIKVEDLKEYKK